MLAFKNILVGYLTNGRLVGLGARPTVLQTGYDQLILPKFFKLKRIKAK